MRRTSFSISMCLFESLNRIAKNGELLAKQCLPKTRCRGIIAHKKETEKNVFLVRNIKFYDVITIRKPQKDDVKKKRVRLRATIRSCEALVKKTYIQDVETVKNVGSYIIFMVLLQFQDNRKYIEDKRGNRRPA